MDTLYSGAQTQELSAGDLVAFQTRGLYAFIIRVGQRLGVLNWRFPYYAMRSIFKGCPDWLDYTDWTHIAYVTETLPDGDAKIVQAVRHVDEVLLSSYAGIPQLVLPYPETASNLQAGIDWARQQVGEDYGIFAIFFKALNECTPEWVRINGERKGHMYCSILAARAWEHMGYAFERNTDVWLLSPSDEVKVFHRED